MREMLKRITGVAAGGEMTCKDCKYYECDKEFNLSYCSLDGESIIDASKDWCDFLVSKLQQEDKA